MYYNNNYNNNMNMGMSYNQNMRMPKMTQPVTKEMAKMLRGNVPAFSLELTKEDAVRSMCTHKDVDNNNIIAIGENHNPNSYGDSVCHVCGETFNLVDLTEEEVTNAVNAVIDILQTTKTYYVDMPSSVVENYFIIIEFLKKLPKLYMMAVNDFNKHENAMMNPISNPFGFNAYNNLVSPGAYGGMGMGNNMMNQQMMMNNDPYMNQGYNQMGMNPQMGYNQNMMNPQMGYNQNMGMNPQMGYNQNMNGQEINQFTGRPMNQGFVQNENGMMQFGNLNNNNNNNQMNNNQNQNYEVGSVPTSGNLNKKTNPDVKVTKEIKA